jgi:dephospho-CoA kinase
MKVIAISGLTECGKGTAARYLERYGIARLKIGDVLMPIYRRSGSVLPFQEWNFEQEGSRPAGLFDEFIAELRMRAANGDSALSIDSLYGPVLAAHLHDRLGRDAIVIYIDAPYETRLIRQQDSAAVSLAEARTILNEKDAYKKARGNLEVRTLADEIVVNSGPMEQFEQQLDAIIARRL